MRLIGKTVLAFGFVALVSSSPALAQGRGFGGGGGGAMLLTNKSVQAELKVTDEQAGKLGEFGQKMQDKQREEGQKLQDVPQDERRAKMQEIGKVIQAEISKGLGDILKPEQVKRFHQVQIQAAGYNAFTQPAVVEKLKLTDDQKAKLAEISTEAGATMREVFQSAGDDRAAAMTKIQELRKATFEKAAALLTADQKSAWKDLIGSPFEVKIEPRQN